MNLPATIIAAIVAAAPAQGIEPAGLLTVTQVETGGRAFEPADLDPSDGIEPCMLFERHRFYARLKAIAPKLLGEAKRQGLAIPKWLGPGSSQYADQKTSAGRLALIARAAAIHPEAAYQACSMGLYQVMGENHAAAGYGSAVEMHAGLTRGGIESHLACGIAFMRSKGLLKHLAGRDWKAFAKGYNGTAYAKNRYDRKLADAYAFWSTKMGAAPVPAEAAADPTILKLGDKNPRVEALQKALVAYGLPVKTDGTYGPKTFAAVASAQALLGMNGDGIATPGFVTKLEAAPRISQGGREVASKKEVKQVSITARIGDRLRKLGWGGTAGVGGYVALFNDKAGQVRDGIDQAKAARDTVQGFVGEGFTSSAGVWLVEHWQSIALAGGCATVAVVGGTLLKHAVDSYREGRLVA